MIVSSIIETRVKRSSEEEFIVLIYEDQRELVPLPQTFDDLERVISETFEDERPFQNVVVETEDLDVCYGKRVCISRAAWTGVAKFLASVYVSEKEGGGKRRKGKDVVRVRPILREPEDAEEEQQEGEEGEVSHMTRTRTREEGKQKKGKGSSLFTDSEDEDEEVVAPTESEFLAPTDDEGTSATSRPRSLLHDGPDVAAGPVTATPRPVPTPATAPSGSGSGPTTATAIRRPVPVPKNTLSNVTDVPASKAAGTSRNTNPNATATATPRANTKLTKSPTEPASTNGSTNPNTVKRSRSRELRTAQAQPQPQTQNVKIKVEPNPIVAPPFALPQPQSRPPVPVPDGNPPQYQPLPHPHPQPQPVGTVAQVQPALPSRPTASQPNAAQTQPIGSQSQSQTQPTRSIRIQINHGDDEKHFKLKSSTLIVKILRAAVAQFGVGEEGAKLYLVADDEDLTECALDKTVGDFCRLTGTDGDDDEEEGERPVFLLVVD